MSYKLPVSAIEAVFDSACQSTGKEAALVQDWLYHKPGQRLKSVDRQTIVIIDPGRRNVHEGPDISNAILFIDGQIRRGAVECHLESTGWLQHGHAQDPNYRNVILHVLRCSPRRNPVLPFPTVVIPAENMHGTTCFGDTDHLIATPEIVLKSFGHRRWQLKMSQYLSETATNEFSDQILQSIFKVLGYGGNSDAFEQLSAMIDRKVLQYNSIHQIHSYLIGLMRDSGLVWHRCGVRPANHPQNRLFLAARLLNLIDVWENSGWAGQPSFECLWHDKIKTVAGCGIQTELLGNVFYPALAARCQVNRELDQIRIHRERWSNLQLPYTYGYISRRFGKLLSVGKLRNFLIIQGIIELNNQYCQPEFCQVCPLKVIYGNS